MTLTGSRSWDCITRAAKCSLETFRRLYTYPLNLDALKLLLLIFFMWFTSPVSTHFVAQVEYFTNEHLEDFVKFKGEVDYGNDNDGDR